MNPEIPAAQPPALAGDDLAAPRIEDNLIRIPDGHEVPQPPEEAAPAPKPWYRRRKPLIAVTAAIAALLGALAVVLSLTVLANNPPSGMGGVLQKDGYPVTAAFTKDQLDQLGAFSGTDGAAIKPFIVGGALGVKHGNEEIVIQFTPDYAAVMRAGLSSELGTLPQGVKAHMTGVYLVMDGSVATLGLPPGVSAT